MDKALNSTLSVNERDAQLTKIRELVSFLQYHPDIPIPHNFAGNLYSCFMPFEASKEEFVRMARKHGFVNKDYSGNYHFGMSLTLPNGMGLILYIEREKVCSKVSTGTRLIPAHEAYEEETFKWVCDEPLLATREGGSDGSHQISG